MKLDFEGLSTPWQSAYAEYGITFVGGTLVQNLGNHYVSGSTTMLFDPSLAINRIEFRGDAYGPDNMLATFVKGEFFEPVMFESGSWTPSGRITGWYPGMMFRGSVPTGGLVDEVHFTNLLALDDIVFDPAVASAAVPEPGTFALVLIATAAITWSRRYVRIPQKA